MTQNNTIEIQRQLSDRPNRQAKVAFVVFYPFQFYIFKNIYKHLAPDAEFVIDAGAFFPKEQPKELLEDIVRLFQKHDVKYRILWYADYFSEEYLEEFFRPYQTLVSLWQFGGCIQLPLNRNKLLINLNYGAGKELTMADPNKRAFDLILCYGPRSKKLLSLYTKTIIVGAPKFDDWFNNEIDLSEIEDIRGRLNPKRRTLLYLPTHSDLCAIDDLAQALINLSSEYNVIVKLHYFTVREEPERVAKLRNKAIILLKDDADLQPLLKVADVVLSDNSSAIFDAILVDKPLVVTDFLSKDYLDVLHKLPRLYQRGMGGALTYSGSIEQIIKRDGLVLSIKKPDELRKALNEAIVKNDHYVALRKELKQELFSFNDGQCGKRAANAISDLMKQGVKPERPILYHVLEAYENKLYRRGLDLCENLYSIRRKMEQATIAKLSQSTTTKKYSIIYHVKSDNFHDSLQSILRQQWDTEKFEISILCDEFLEISLREAVKIENTKKIPTKILCHSERNWGAVFEEAIGQSFGDVVCFSSSPYLYPSNWLLQLHQAYEKHPDIVGAGVYVQKMKTTWTQWDFFTAINLNRQLGISSSSPGKSTLFEVTNNLIENPAGDLSCMSYRKDTLIGVPVNYQRLHDVQVLGFILKSQALRHGPVCFIPSPVYDRQKLTFDVFWRDCIERGRALFIAYMLAPLNYQKRYFYRSVSKIIRLVFASGTDIQIQWRNVLTLVTGFTLEWIGFWLGRVQRLNAQLQRKARG